MSKRKKSREQATWPLPTILKSSGPSEPMPDGYIPFECSETGEVSRMAYWNAAASKRRSSEAFGSVES